MGGTSTGFTPPPPPSLQGASWLWNVAGHSSSTPAGTVYVRKTFTVTDPASIARAQLRINADDSHVTYVNGQQVAQSAGGNNAWQTSQIVDVKPHLVAGTNVIAVALVLWEMDRGGPFRRWSNPRSAVPAADLRFSQDEDKDTDPEVKKASAFSPDDWRPQFFDYLYSSLSNAMAFSASDSMPLSIRAKALMGLEALSGFVILALVIARAVSLLG